jgi:hypothetical protein
MVNSNALGFFRSERVDQRDKQHCRFTGNDIDDRFKELNGKLLDWSVCSVHLQQDRAFVELADLSVYLDVLFSWLRSCRVPAQEIQVAEDLLVCEQPINL